MKSTLDKLKKGQAALIESISNSDISIKLAEMGCFAGEKLTIQHIAPLGDPIAINVSGYLISLRKKDAKTINVSF